MLALAAVCKRFDTTPALREVDLVAEAGRTTVLIGPSGCGKSTVLRAMIGLVEPDSGRVSFGGRTVDASWTRELRRRTGYVIQDGGLFPHLSARSNATLMARHLGWEARGIEERLAELVELTRFPSEALDRYPVQLSGGQRQRVGLMRALMLDPEVLLLDEPLAALDPMIRCELQEELRAIFRALGKTVVLVTHDLMEAGFLGDALVLMREGRVVQTGTFEDLLESPTEPFVREFVRAQRLGLDREGGA